MQHTPGPWTYKKLKHRGYTAIKTVTNEAGKEVARITDDYGCVEDANARLIAAAPDLYSALNLIASFLEGTESVLNPLSHNDKFIIREAMAAIAKVEEG